MKGTTGRAYARPVASEADVFASRRKPMPMFRSPALFVAIAVVTAAGAIDVAHATSPGEPPPPSFGAATPLTQLQSMSGGTATQTTNNVNEQDTQGTLTDNTAKGTYSGGNFVGDTAFSSSAGLSTVIQNSGNNVLIQNSTILNVRMNP
jgi:hypothetical protein